MSDQPVESSPAVIRAMQGVYDMWAPEMDPHGDPIFEVAFQTNQGVKIFWINPIEYSVLKTGQTGILRWKGDEFLSFAPWIKPTV